MLRGRLSPALRIVLIRGCPIGCREHTKFPNSMVDRITPVTTPDVISGLAEQFGIEDGWPVVAEPFTAWALEDDFAAGRPPLEDVACLTVADVTPYELMKLRLLNASHQGICYFAYLAGYRLVHDAASDPLFAEFLPLYEFRSDAHPQARPGNRPARLQAHADRTVRQSKRARHHRPVVRRFVRPHSEVVGAGDSYQPGIRCAHSAVGSDRGELGPVCGGRRRGG